MAKKELCLDTLGDLDGGVVRLMIDREIDKIITDLEDRGVEDKLPRYVNLQLQVSIVEDRVVVRVKAEGKIPPKKTRATHSALRTRAGRHFLEFQSEAPDNPEQETFPYTEPEEGK